MRLADKLAVVTGAGSGIGRAIAQAFAREGATVAVVDVREAPARETVSLLAHGKHAAFTCDVADGAAVARTFDAIDAAFGRIDVVVNNAGVDKVPGDGMDKLMENRGLLTPFMSDEAFQRMMAINVFGVFACTREGVKRMLRDKRGGAVINMSSIAGLSGQGVTHYSASKSAVLGLTRATARELGPHGIRVNAICPGVIDTPMAAGVPEAALKPLLGATPLRRIGKPEDIANAAVYLASEESSFVTGQWISPNGGLVMV
ncbi:MAG: 3-oxoacyl-ACP reductase FabG [Deltaproteobacteria bacterium]|nr:3-oxoacyl-ACP reductase FabG [Deltaproteobacteria bacterium]